MNTDLNKPPDEDELEELNRFLLNRISDDEDGKDPGIYSVSGLDGFLTAIVSGPESVQPSRWLPALWGDYDPVWETEEDFMKVFSVMIRLMNQISYLLMEEPHNYEPLFHERKAEGGNELWVEPWCEGYVRALKLSVDHWEAADDDLQKMLFPIVLFGTDHGHSDLEERGEQAAAQMREILVPCITRIHAFWLDRRIDLESPVRHSTPRTGRNEPCPCGSGKKYKKCCLGKD